MMLIRGPIYEQYSGYDTGADTVAKQSQFFAAHHRQTPSIYCFFLTNFI